MRLLSLVMTLAMVSILGCTADEEPQCDFEDGELECPCDDGTLGVVTCNDDGTANCICNGPPIVDEDVDDRPG